MVYSKADIRTFYRQTYAKSGIFQVSSRCSFATSVELPTPSNDKKIKHHQLSIMWKQITQAGNYLDPFILPFLRSGCLRVSLFFKTTTGEAEMRKGIEKG